MGGIYIHIPYCKQACHYCNFHFATSLRHKNELLAGLLKEMEFRKDYFGGEPVDTIYFGGGTPSLLTAGELESLIRKAKALFDVSASAEITLEANPDDMAEEYLKGWKTIGINRLSIGVQSFFDEDLKWMNRAHDSKQAIESLLSALNYLNNISIDLIYGTPTLTNERWQYNVDKAVSLGIPHLSCYALTVEAKTPLQKMINTGKSENVSPDKQSEQFLLLMDWLRRAGYEHYEISNFAKPDYRSQHNSSYWQGKKYLGIGPSAHSFDGSSRQWNIANNKIYIDSILKGMLPFEKEVLTETQKINEYIMTSLRTMEGLDLDKLDGKMGEQLIHRAGKYVTRELLMQKDRCLVLTDEGKLLADGIAADLFM